ncbi:MAG: hypothetical protein ABFD66_04590 [Smithella sp.]
MAEPKKPKNPRTPISVRPSPEQQEEISEAKKKSFEATGIFEKDSPFVLRMAMENIERLWPELKGKWKL